MKTTRLLQLGAALAVALLPLSSVRAQAADGDKPPAHKPASVEDLVAKLKKRLDLTDDQVTKVKAIYEDQKSQVDAINKDTTLSKEQKHEKVKPIREATKAKVDAVLTPEQKAKVDEARKKREEKQEKKDQ